MKEWTIESKAEWTVVTARSWKPTALPLASSSGSLAFGEENPSPEEAVSWQTWDDGAGGNPPVTGEPNWGKIQLSSGERGHSAVYDFGDETNRYHTLEENRYGVGQGDATLYIRGQAGTFNQDDVDPAWEEYSGGVWKTWRFMQIRVEK